MTSIKNICISLIKLLCKAFFEVHICEKKEQKTQKMSSKINEEKKELARLYYMQGEQQDNIAEKVGVSKTTLCKWVKDGAWSEKRAGLNITRPEIVNKNLILISRLLDKLNDSEINLGDTGKIVDQICKLTAAIERIDKKASVVDAIEVFTALNKWLLERMKWDSNITPELLRTFEHYQDLYINEHIKNNNA